MKTPALWVARNKGKNISGNVSISTEKMDPDKSMWLDHILYEGNIASAICYPGFKRKTGLTVKPGQQFQARFSARRVR